jgi:hypothetical protein
MFEIVARCLRHETVDFTLSPPDTTANGSFPTCRCALKLHRRAPLPLFLLYIMNFSYAEMFWIPYNSSYFRFFDKRFEPREDVNVVFNTLCARANNDENVVSTRSDGLLNTKLNNGFINKRQHRLGHRVASLQKSNPQTYCRYNGFFNHSTTPN